MVSRILIGLALIIAATSAFAGELSGTASYRERIALPPEAKFIAILYDISNNDQVEIGRFEAPGDEGPPYAFTIEFANDAVMDGGRYAVKAQAIWQNRPYVAAGTILDGYPTENLDVDLVMVRPGVSASGGAGVTKGTEKPEMATMIGAHGLSLPTGFEGTVQNGSRRETWQLALAADQTFQLSRTFQDDGTPAGRRDSLGRWSTAPTSDTFILRDGAEIPLTLRKVGLDRLSVIDARTGAVFDGALSATKNETIDLSDMLIAGMMTHMADAAILEECQSGLIFPIATQDEYAALEAAYLSDRPAPGEPLYVMLEGGILLRPAMEGPSRQMVTVDKFIRTRPGITCERQLSDANLQNTYWRLDELEGTSFPSDATNQEPQLLLETNDAVNYRATVGCNRIRGTYALDGNLLSFSPAVSTRMACPEPLDELERQFGFVLSEASGFAIEGETLILRDTDGEPRAVFTAVYF